MSKQNDFTEALDLIRNIIRKALGYRGDEDATQEALCWAWAEFERRYDSEPDKHDLARSAASNGAKYANRGRRFVPTSGRGKSSVRAELAVELDRAIEPHCQIMPDCPIDVREAFTLVASGHTYVEAAEQMGMSLYAFRRLIRRIAEFTE